MSQIKVEKKAPRVNGRLNHAHDNPYLTSSNVELDSFRCKMQDILNLYLYMNQPDYSHSVIRRPKHVPFLTRNLHYMQKDVNYSMAKPNARYKTSSSSLIGTTQAPNDSDAEELPCSCMCPSLTFFRVRFEDQKSDYDYADIQCFRARQIDGQFGRTEPVEAAHFHMRLNDELKVDIDLPNFEPDIPEKALVRHDYLLVKVEVRPDGIAVSGGRKLRSVPARQAAQSELKHAQDPEHPAASQPEVRVLFGLKKITTARQSQQGHTIQDGRSQVNLIYASDLGVDAESNRWQYDVNFVPRLLQILKRPVTQRLPFVRVEVFVDDEDATYSTCGSALSSARTTPAPQDKQRSGADSASGYASSSASSVTNTSFCGGNTNTEKDGILGVVSSEHRQEMIKAKMPTQIAWCFKMSDSVMGKSLNDQADSLSNAAYLSSLADPPPADVFRFTGNECAICSPGYRRSFPTFVSLLYHLCTMHPRLSFKFRKNLSPVTADDANGHESSRRSAFSPNGSQKSDSSSTNRRRSQMIKIEPDSDSEFDQKPSFKQSPGFVVSLNRSYNGSHEFDSSRHYIKRLSALRQGIGIRRRPEAWNRPPVFLVVRNLARNLRMHPPSRSFDELESRGVISDSTFGGSAQWLDPHFHTRSFAQCHAPFKQIVQRRRIHDFIDVNENEKEMLKILSDFHASFRTILMNHQAYPSNVILVREQRETLLRPSIYTQFIIHLSNLKRYGNLHTSELYDLVSRLNHGSDYDPRADPKHFVHITLKQLEKQRPVHVENQKRNGVNKKNQVSRNIREASISSAASTSSSITSASNESGNKQKSSGVMTRKRSFDGSAGTNSSTGTSTAESKRGRPNLMSTINETDGEKKRQFKTQTPMDVLLQNSTLKPEHAPISCFDDLACRYQFASEKQLRLIWHFIRNWERKCLEWQ